MDAKEVERTLAVIRKLIERGERYEAVTGRGALLAGAAALVAAGFLASRGPASDGVFLLTWLAVAVLAATWTAATAMRASRRRDGRAVTAQARAVATAVLPAYVSAAVLTAAAWRGGDLRLLPAAWMLLHGVAILATGHHAPRRLVRLGVAFLLAGAVAAFAPLSRNASMALAFGGINVAYGLLSVAMPAKEPT